MQCKWSYLSVLLFQFMFGYGQEIIPLRNPSLESLPGPAKTPNYWHFCGPPQETPPDVHPSGAFGVQKKAAHGLTYMGLVVRDNGTTEKISQRLSSPLQKEKTYRLQCYTAKPEVYRSVSRSTMRPDSFTRAIRLRLWGVKHCEKIELLGESDLITHSNWELTHFEFTPTVSIPGIMLEAWYEEDDEHVYNGGVFVDLVSPIYEVEQNAIHSPRLPLQADVESIKSFVYQETQKLALDPSNMPKRDFIINEDSCYFFTALPLWDIGRMMSRSPKAKLHLATPRRGAALFKEEINEALQLGGLPSFRIKWHKIKKPGKGKRWVANDPKRTLFVGISGI